MLQYDREVADEYDDYDEYEDEQEEDGEDEEYEEEERKPSAEELEYLGLRERLKQRIRKKRSNEDNSALTRSQDSKKLPFNNFGSFFGPSQPVLAQRVIQESKTLLENPHLAMRRLSNPNHGNRKSTSSGTAGSKQQVQNKQTKVRNELHTKVQKLKDVRDYSFLLSDDAELPAPKRNDAQRNTPRPNSEGRSIQLSHRTKLPSDNGKRTQNSNEERRSVSASRDVQLNVGPHRAVPASKPNSASVDPRRQLSSNTKTLQGRPSGQKPLPSRPPEKPLPSKSSAKPIPSKSSEKPVHSKSYEKPMPSKSYEKQLPSKSYEKPMPSKSSVPALERRLPAPGSKSILPATHKTPLSRPQSSVPKKPLDQRNGFRETNRSKTVQPRPMASSKPQINQAVKRASTQSSLRDDRPKKKPLRRYSDDEDDEGENALSMIRRMFNTSRFAGRDDDDSDMEANFDDILREEQRSARIARQEDEEQLRLIEEEERREHMRKLKKQRW